MYIIYIYICNVLSITGNPNYPLAARISMMLCGIFDLETTLFNNILNNYLPLVYVLLILLIF